MKLGCGAFESRCRNAECNWSPQLLVGLSYQLQHDQRHSALLLPVTLGSSCDVPLNHHMKAIMRRSSCYSKWCRTVFFFQTFFFFSISYYIWNPDSSNRSGMRLYFGTASSEERKMQSLRFPARTSTPSVRYPRSSSKPLLHSPHAFVAQLPCAPLTP